MEQQTPPAEESIFNEADYSMEGYDKHVRHARIALYVLAALTFCSIALMTPVNSPERWISVGFVVFVALIFFVLGLWSKKRPFTAILTALILFVGLQVLNGILDPSSLLQGWYVKIAVTLFLILGLRNAKEIQDRRKAFGK